MTTKVELVSVVIPTLNEAGNILETIAIIERELAYPKEIIIVDGNSTDGTKDLVKDTKCRLIVQPKRGYGNALMTGIREAKGNVIVMVDGDGTYEMSHINLLLETLVKTDSELCMATRMAGLHSKSMGFWNYFGNRLITICFNMLYKQTLTDTQSGFRAFSLSAIEKVDLGEVDMAFATEMLIKFAKKGFRMIEVPTIYKPRKYGKTKLKKFNSGMQIFGTMFKGLRE